MMLHFIWCGRCRIHRYVAAAFYNNGGVPVEGLPAVVAEEELPAHNALAEGGDEAGALREVPHPGHVVLPQRIEDW
jgi:hypothetical protein